MDASFNTCQLREALDAAAAGPVRCSPALTSLMAFSALVQAALRRSAERSPRPPASLDGQTFDFIVVGAGAAGSVLANRLTAAPHRYSVLLLEAGGEEPFAITDEPGIHSYFLGSALDWNYTTEAEPRSCGGAGCPYPRGKALGGSTAINSMQYVRGNPRDFDAWRDAGNPGWGWRDVLPFFKRFEDNRNLFVSYNKEYHAVGGPQSIEQFPTADINALSMFDAFEELGLPARLDGGSGDEEHRRSVQAFQCFARDGRRQSANKAYLRGARARRELRVVTRARVTRVLLDEDETDDNGDDDGGSRLRARGVEFADDALGGRGPRRAVYARKEVILAAGAIGTPQILQLSGVGPKAVLDAVGIKQVLELPVGLNFQDHTAGRVVDLVPANSSSVPASPAGWVAAQREYNARQNGPMASTNVMVVFAYFNTSGATADWPDIEVTLGPLLDGAPRCASTLDEARQCADQRRDVKCAAVSYPFYNAITVDTSIVRPRSRGNVTLRSADPFAAPRIHPNFLGEAADRTALLEASRFALRLPRTRALRRAGFLLNTTPSPQCAGRAYGSDEYVRCCLQAFTRSNYHACCSARMGPDGDRTAVLDARLRVRGVAGLRVVDASVMPSITSGNTAAPTIMIGEKGAQMVLDDWRAE